MLEAQLSSLQNNIRLKTDRLRLLSARGETYTNFKGRTFGGLVEWGVGLARRLQFKLRGKFFRRFRV